MGGGGSQTQKTESEPWGPQQPHLTFGFDEAKKLYQQGMPVPQSPQSDQALKMMEARAMYGSPLVAAGQNQLADTITGGYLNQNPAGGYFQNAAQFGLSGIPFAQGGIDALSSTARGDMLNANPYLDAMYGKASGQVADAYQRSIAPTTAGGFNRAGRYGSGAYDAARRADEETLGRTLGDLGTQIYGGNYATERGNQMQAAGLLGQLGSADVNARLQGAQGLSSGYENERQRMMGGIGLAPGLAATDYDDATHMAAVGAAREAMEQQKLDAPWGLLGRYQQSTAGNYGGQSETQIPGQKTNPLQSILGLGLTGAGLFGGGGFGSLFGAAAGGLTPNWGVGGFR